MMMMADSINQEWSISNNDDDDDDAINNNTLCLFNHTLNSFHFHLLYMCPFNL